MTLTGEQKKAWRRALDRAYLSDPESRDIGILADALVDALAELAESEFKRKHTKCRVLTCSDPRHYYSKTDWREAVRKELSE